MASVTGAPNGAEEISLDLQRPDLELPADALRGVRSNVDGRPVIDLMVGLLGFGGGVEAAITCDGDPAEVAFALERLASTLLATAHDVRRRRTGGHETTHVLMGGALVPMCACGQPAGHPDGAFS